MGSRITQPTNAVLRHYFRTTLRVLGRQLSFSVINLIGLSIGIATALLLLLFVRNELTFDGFHEKADRTYRAWVLEQYGPDQQHFNTITPVRIGGTLADGLPEVEAFARFDQFNDTVRLGDVTHNEVLYMVDPAFLDIFDFEVLRGDRATMFASQENIVLTESAAARYFGPEEPMGRVLSVDFGGEPRQFAVAGIMADPPENSSLQFEILLPYAITEWFYSPRMHEAWFNVSPETYVLLRDDADHAAVEAKIPGVITAAIGDRVEPGQYTVGLQPLTDIHTNPEFPQGYAPVVNPVYVRILLALALLILAVASINFVTLSVSRSLSRAREIGVRKVVGADRPQLMGQYWGEALILTGVSLAMGVALARAALPGFNDLAQRELALALDPGTIALALAIFLGVGLLAGLYPALVLSGFDPIDAFRGRVPGRSDRSIVRRVLVTAQFGMAILLVAGTLVIRGQLDYLKAKDLGFNKEMVVTIPTTVNTSQGKDIADRLRFALDGRDDILSVSAAAMFFDENGWVLVGYRSTDGSYRRHYVNVVDYDFVETMGLQLTRGRDFDRNQASDPDRAIIINESLAAAYGWEEPLEGLLPGQFDEHEVVGVVRDFHFTSLHTAIQPALFVLTPNVAFSGANDTDYDGSFAPDIAIRIAGGDVPGTLAAIAETWAEVAPESPFSYEFLDETLAAQYRQEDRLSEIVSLGALLSILIAGLGLFGLAALSVARRTKEIGLRKVLGASLAGILGLFTREFGVLVLTAFVVAVPTTWIAMNQWLDTFDYQTPLGPLPFVLAGLAALGVMLVAVASQATRAALSNPVDALRDE